MSISVEDARQFEGKIVNIDMNSPRWGHGMARGVFVRGAANYKLWVYDRQGRTKFIEYQNILSITEV